ncbi:MAG: hypothetical protein ABJF23_10475 [Bryobacteraceae bacterium]
MPTTVAELDLTPIPGKVRKLLYPGGVGPLVQKAANGATFVHLDLAPHQFVILA